MANDIFKQISPEIILKFVTYQLISFFGHTRGMSLRPPHNLKTKTTFMLVFSHKMCIFALKMKNN